MDLENQESPEGFRNGIGMAVMGRFRIHTLQVGNKNHFFEFPIQRFVNSQAAGGQGRTEAENQSLQKLIVLLLIIYIFFTLAEGMATR